MGNIAVESAERPVGHARYQPVFHRIVVDIIEVALEIDFVTDGMFPIAALPNALFSFQYLAH